MLVHRKALYLCLQSSEGSLCALANAYASISSMIYASKTFRPNKHMPR